MGDDSLAYCGQKFQKANLWSEKSKSSLSLDNQFTHENCYKTPDLNVNTECGMEVCSK